MNQLLRSANLLGFCSIHRFAVLRSFSSSPFSLARVTNPIEAFSLKPPTTTDVSYIKDPILKKKKPEAKEDAKRREMDLLEQILNPEKTIRIVPSMDLKSRTKTTTVESLPKITKITASIPQPESLKAKRSRLFYQSKSRGLPQASEILTLFAKSYLPYMSAEELSQYDAFINDISDWDLFYFFVSKERAIPSSLNRGVVVKLTDFVEWIGSERLQGRNPEAQIQEKIRDRAAQKDGRDSTSFEGVGPNEEGEGAK